MNRTEAAYAAHLEEQKQLGAVQWYAYEAINLRLAEKSFYRVDFFVMLADDTLEAHEVKGLWESNARTKIKVAASLYPFRFIAVRAIPKRDGGGWAIEDF